MDQRLVLPNDMLMKVDLMSMANSLEVRVPFLDSTMADFANELPVNYKVDRRHRKKILQDAFKPILPPEIYNRPKKGFEVPLLSWMRKELSSELDHVLFDKDFLEDQNLFSPEEVMKLRPVLHSRNPGDVHAIIWALYVFQKWHKNYLI